jgi:LPS sulfotransferase NodH
MPDYAGLEAHELMGRLFSRPNYIWMVRRDKVGQAVSWAKAAQTGIYARHRGEMPVPQQEPEFDFRLINNLYGLILEGEAGWSDFFKRCGVKPFKVVYEDLVEAYEPTALNILRYLNIPYPENLLFEERKLQKQADALNEAWAERYVQLKKQRGEWVENHEYLQ